MENLFIYLAIIIIVALVIYVISLRKTVSSKNDTIQSLDNIIRVETVKAFNFEKDLGKARLKISNLSQDLEKANALNPAPTFKAIGTDLINGHLTFREGNNKLKPTITNGTVHIKIVKGMLKGAYIVRQKSRVPLTILSKR